MSTTSGAGRSPKTPDGETPHRAGAFDIRVFIASLIGIYGIVLVLVGLFGTSQTDIQKKADGLNINLLAGIGMVVVAALFLLWARLRPVVVPPHHEDA